MSDRFKYAMNGIYKCDNFTEQVEQNRFPEIFIGAIEGFSVCYLKCTLITKDNQILNFHCPQFVEQAEKIVPRGLHAWHFFRCLQILHGVRLQFNESDYFNVLEIARSFNFSNVIQYIDRLHFEGRHCFWETKSLSFDRVIDFNLKHVLAEKLKELSRKDVVEVAKKLDFTEATGEVMKTFVAKILYN
ncbi:unnamed protein product [Caenorhabditis brenneri]